MKIKKKIVGGVNAGLFRVESFETATDKNGKVQFEQDDYLVFIQNPTLRNPWIITKTTSMR